MLERAASTCVDLSIRRPVRHIGEHLRRCSRHYETRDSVAGSSIPPRPLFASRDIPRRSYPHHGQGPLLDFLYPPKTLALMRRMSASGQHGRGGLAMSGSSRAFSANAEEDLEDHNSSSAQVIASLAGERPNPSYATAKPMETLRKLLQGPLPAHSKSDVYETAWQLYLQLTPDQRTQRLFVGLINYLSFSTRSEDYIRSSWLLDQSPFLKSQNQLDRSATQYWAALVQQLRMGNTREAVKVHESAMRSKAEGYIGTNLLLAQLLKAKEWKYAIAVYSAKMATIADADKDWLRDDRADLWDFVDRLPNLLSLTCTLFGRERLGPRSGGRYIRDFLEKLIVKAVVQCLQSNPGPKDCKIIRDLILQLGPELPGLHDIVMKQIVKVLKSLHLQARNYLDISQLLADVLDLSKATNHYHANAELLFDTAVVMAKSAPLAARFRWWGFSHDQFSKKFLEITEESKSLIGREPETLHKAAMRMYAKLGNVTEVVGLFDKMSKGKMHEGIALPVLELFATKAEPRYARDFFERLRDEFKWQPTTRCWNTLLRILARADDVARGVSYFEEMLETGVGLDAHSYLPILQLYSRRGAVDKIENLLGMAQFNGVLTDAKMFYYLVIANLEVGDVLAAEQAARAVIQARKSERITGPTTLVWNALLEAYGRRRDWANVMRIFSLMVEENISPNTQTHAALLEALCNQHKAGEAWRLLQGLQKQNGRDVIPAHYREVMLGFISQRQPSKALRVYDRMCEAGVKPDGSVIAVHTRAKALFEAHDATPTKNVRQMVDAKFSKTLEKIIKLAETDPGKGTSEVLGGAKEAVAATLIMNYGSANQADAVAKWFNTVMESQEVKTEMDLQPMTVLRARMISFLHARDDAELETCWQQYVHQAEIFAAEVPDREPGGSRLEAHTKPPPLYPSRRNLLSGPLVLYMKSLSSQGKRAQIRSTVLTLLDRGWKLDNIAWNEYVRCLVARTGPGDSPINDTDAAHKRIDAEDGFVVEEDRSRASEAMEKMGRIPKTAGAGFGEFLMDIEPGETIAVLDGNLDSKSASEETQFLAEIEEEVNPRLASNMKEPLNEASPLSETQRLEVTELNKPAPENDLVTEPPELELVGLGNDKADRAVAAGAIDAKEFKTNSNLDDTADNDDIKKDDSETLIQDEPSPSDILTAFRVCEQRLMPNFPGWVDKARPLHASERRGKYAGGLYWMKTENLGRRLYQGLLVPQFETLSILRDTIDQLERKAYIEEFEEENVGVFSDEGATMIATATDKPWDDAAWGLSIEAKAQEEAKRLERLEIKLKMQQEEESRERLSKVILEQGEVPREVQERDIHVPADIIIDAVRSWAPLTVDAAMLIPIVVEPEGFGKMKEVTKKKTWLWKTIRRWTRQLQSNQTRIEKLRNLLQAMNASEYEEEKKRETRERLDFLEKESRDLEVGAITKTFELGTKKAWLKKVSDRERFAIKQYLAKRKKSHDEYLVAYPTDRKGKALFIFGEGEPPAPEDDTWLEELDHAAEEILADKIRQKELDREFKRQAEEERRALEGGAMFSNDDRTNDRMKKSKRRQAKVAKKGEKVGKKEGTGGESEAADALSALEQQST